jgi:hypothetical protein
MDLGPPHHRAWGGPSSPGDGVHAAPAVVATAAWWCAAAAANGKSLLLDRPDGKHQSLLFFLGHMGLLGRLLLLDVAVAGPMALLATARTGAVRRRS